MRFRGFGIMSWVGWGVEKKRDAVGWAGAWGILSGCEGCVYCVFMIG